MSHDEKVKLKSEVEKAVPKEASELLAMHKSKDEDLNATLEDDTLEEETNKNKRQSGEAVTSVQETPDISAINVRS